MVFSVQPPILDFFIHGDWWRRMVIMLLKKLSVNPRSPTTKILICRNKKILNFRELRDVDPKKSSILPAKVAELGFDSSRNIGDEFGW